MHESTLPSLVLVFAIAALTPLLADVPKRVKVPAVVLEIGLGVVIGPQLLDLAQPDEFIELLAEFGLAYLIFLAGFEIDLDELRGEPARLASTAWVASLALGLLAGLAATASGLALSSIVVGLALTTTALGTLLPILRDAGLSGTPFGTHVLAGGALGEFGPILAIALVLGTDAPARRVLSLALFAVIAGATIWLSRRATPAALERLMRTTLHTSGQLVVRLCVLAIAGLVWWAAELGLDILLGAFAAGIVARFLVHAAHDEHDVEVVDSKLEAIGFGFLVPLFFVVSGMRFDLDALLDDPAALVRVPLFLGLFVVVRGLPVLVLYRSVLGAATARALALTTSAALPLVVVITDIGVRTDRMRPSNAASLVGAGMLSVLLLPMIGVALQRRAERHDVRERADVGVS